MKIAVTGATGFIGEALVPTLLERGHSVTALTRQPESARRKLPSTVEVAGWNPKESASLHRCDVLINLAGESVAGRWTPAKKQAIHDSRILGTRSLVDAIATMNPRPALLLNASAVGIYGNQGDEVLTEDSEPGTDFLAQVCRDWEAEAKRAEEFGLRVGMLRIGIVLGTGGGALPKMALPFKWGVGGKIGDGKQWVSWIHREDLVGLCLHALEREEITGPMNAVAPEPVQNETFTKQLAKALHRPAVIPVPAFALRLALGEFAESVLGGQRVRPQVAQSTGCAFKYPTLPSAFQAIFKP